MANMLTVVEASRLIGRSSEATRKLIERYGVERLRDANGHTFRVRTADILRVARKSEAR
jgi:hypothetical protein